jgi:hypothetical protein
MATKGRTKTKGTKQVCYGKKSGCLYKGKDGNTLAWDSHPENPANQPGKSSMNKSTMKSHISSLMQGGYNAEAKKWQTHYKKTYKEIYGSK